MRKRDHASSEYLIEFESVFGITIASQSARVMIFLIHGNVCAIPSQKRSLKKGAILNDRFETKLENSDDFFEEADFTIT